MSLDFYLEEQIEKERDCDDCDEVHICKYNKIRFHKNITHNLAEMADAAGIYDCLWHPNEHGFEYAHQIIKILEKGLDELVRNPNKFKPFNPENAWGSYEGLIKFASAVLDACKEYPNAKIRTCT